MLLRLHAILYNGDRCIHYKWYGCPTRGRMSWADLTLDMHVFFPDRARRELALNINAAAAGFVYMYM